MVVVTATSAAMGALSQAKTSVWAPIIDKIAASNDMEEICTVLNEAVAMLGKLDRGARAKDVAERLKVDMAGIGNIDEAALRISNELEGSIDDKMEPRLSLPSEQGGQDYLLECWEAEALLGDDNGARKTSMNGRHVLRHLKNKSLLEDGHQGIIDLGILIPNQVRGCLIEGYSELETNSVTQPNLEHLYMKNLPKLEGIWNDRTKTASLTKLKTLVLIEKAVLTTGNMDLLPKLRKLSLRDLPKLESICSNESSKWSALEKLKIHYCPALHKLPFSEDNAEMLKLIKAEKHWLEALQW
ncbi:hypothetical protein Acr_06g0012210 [Actinidia rufa]|uniref:Rx N-terminal domain-containing protein n=1 Tax=Actinidia rufa TaxID=165716 RepID=A0A7J0ES26_9ERIC|nr:hypothetical protein Acr_06g0012210 [Actinidia rufa]